MATENDPKTVDPDWTPPGVEDVKQAAPVAPESEDPVEALKKQLEEERLARIAAERRADQHAKTAYDAELEKADNQLHLVNTAIARVKEQSDQLEAAYEQAINAGDGRAAAQLQREMAANEAKLLQLENGKAAMESAPKPSAPAPANPVEALAAQLTPRSAAWVRAHPEYATDPQKYQGMIGAHNAATSRGIAPDTDEYFEVVELALGIRSAPRRIVEDDADAMSTAAKPVRDTAPPAAPPSRGGSNGRAIRLSAEEIEMAEMSGMSPEDYARNKEALRKEGRLH